jgi:hypothetical protein
MKIVARKFFRLLFCCSQNQIGRALQADARLGLTCYSR